MSDEQRRILNFLKDQSLTVISTMDREKGGPESALVAFAEMDNFELVFGTMSFARKYKNITQNSRVSFVFGLSSTEHVTVQYEGSAKELKSEEYLMCRDVLLKKKTPCTEEFLSNRDFILFKVTPAWVALSDYTGQVPKIIELKFQ